MVDISSKEVTQRHATAQAVLHAASQTITLLRDGQSKKGDAIAAARIAGIQAAKRTSELIPLCHVVPLNKCSVEIDISVELITVTCSVTATARTGVEMEALVGASTAALTLYDMLKFADKKMEIGSVHVVFKTGGKSGDLSWEKSASV